MYSAYMAQIITAVVLVVCLVLQVLFAWLLANAGAAIASVLAAGMVETTVNLRSYKQSVPAEENSAGKLQEQSGGTFYQLREWGWTLGLFGCT